MRMRIRRNRLVVDNIGTAAAEDVQVQIEDIDQGEPPKPVDGLRAERILAQGAVEFLLIVSMGTATQWRVTFTWREGDREFAESQTVTAL
jgi:hypothetical protein